MDWLKPLMDLVEQNSIVISRFSHADWVQLLYSRRSISKFTVARPHSLLSGIRLPAVGLLFGADFGEDYKVGDPEICLCLVDSSTPVTTLESRITFVCAKRILPSTEHDLVQLITKRGFKSKLRGCLRAKEAMLSLPSELSVHLIERLAARKENHNAMRSVVAALNSPKTYSNNAALQQDAVSLALKAFGISPTETAIFVETAEDRDTALARVDHFENEFVKIHEDAVIEHDARNVPGFTFIRSDLTGRAVFENGYEQLEVITANRRPLEEVFGVDLIYLNVIKQNVVMVQYKMLEPHRKDRKTDWIFRPDRQFDKEMERMKRFSQLHAPGPLEYRINPQVFYLRFVRRDANLGKVTATMPIDHFQVLRNNPECKGLKGGFRITYDTLEGRYLRQNGFLDLVGSGYIGAHAKTTADLETLIREILNGNRALVAALHSTRSSSN